MAKDYGITYQKKDLKHQQQKVYFTDEQKKIK